MTSFVQPLTLLASSNTKWTATQEKTIARDYPFADLHLETLDQFVARTYLQFLWLPESIMPINLLVPSLRRVQDASPRSPDSPHPLHALLDPLLLSVRSAVAKYHTELPQILAQDGGEGETEESMMWYAFGYEMGEIGEGSTSANNEETIMLEDKSRRMWLERLERREVQIQILLYLLKLSLPGPCAPLPPVEMPANGVVPSTKKRRTKERTKVVTPTTQERLEAFMDKLSIWQLVINMNDSNKRSDNDKHDWTQTFCENIVERQFKSALPDMCALLHHKLFPHSPFEDEDENSGARSSPTSRAAGSAPSRPNPSRKLARSSTSASVSQSAGRPNPKPVQRSSSVLSSATVSDARPRSRSLSVSLAQDASARRCSAASGTSSSLRRALSREVSMSRGFKPRAQHSKSSQSERSSRKVPDKAKEELKRENKHPHGVTLVAATPTKPKVRTDPRSYRQATSPSQGRAFSPIVEDEDGISDNLGDTDKEGGEELWLPSSSPDVFLLGARKRAASGSSSSMGLSDPTEEGVETPVKKRPRR